MDMPNQIGNQHPASQHIGEQQRMMEMRKRDKLDSMMQKKERIDNMRSFLNLKRKIYSLINMGKPEEARNTYDTLFMLYQSMLKDQTPQHLAVIKNSISEVYTELERALNKKRVKKGHFAEVEMKKDDKARRTKIVTTDLDVIMQLIEEKGKLTLADIQARFNIGRHLAEEWIQILADYGLIEIRYLPIGGVEVTKIK